MKAVYIDASDKWSVPANLGFPVNSASNDLYFRLSSDGSNAVFCSDNSGGFGLQDIYMAYFKRSMPEQLITSFPPAFTTAPLDLTSKPIVSENTEKDLTTSSEDPEFPTKENPIDQVIPTLQYGEGENVLQPVNVRKLEEVFQLLELYTDARVLMECHSNSEGNLYTDLYFSVKRAEQAAEFLINKGISSGRIQIKGCGSSYPLVRQIKDSEAARNMFNLNKRIYVYIFSGEKNDLNLMYARPNINTFSLDSSAIIYNKKIKGLSYKIQVAAARQMLKNNLLLDYKDPAVEKNFDKNYYLYTLGLFRTYKEAYQLKRKLQVAGSPDAFIVPYLDGFRLTWEEAKKYKTDYQDLESYFRP